MLKRGCLRDREHKGQCLNCALLPQCAVWPIVAPADPTNRQRGPYARPFVLRMPDIPLAGLPVGARLTYGMTIVQDTTFPSLWGAFAAAFIMAARQVAEWGFALAVREGEQASRRGAVSVGRVRWINPITAETQPYTVPDGQPESLPLVANFDAADVSEESDHVESMRLTFVTPTRLVAAGRTVQHPEPGVLLRRAAERIDAVAASVGAAKPDLLGDDEFLTAVDRLELRDDDTRWSGDAAKGAFTGSATLSGTAEDLARVVHVVRWGAALGVGKGTLHGAGRFVIDDVPSTARISLADIPPQRVTPSPVIDAKPAPRLPVGKRPPQVRKRTPRGNRTR